VCFPLLELFIGVKIRIFVVKTNAHSHMNKTFTLVIHEGALIDIRRCRPVNCMLHESFLKLLIINLPDLLQTEPIVLFRQTILIQVEHALDLFS